MPSTCTGATDSLVFGFCRWSAWRSATPYRTSAPGRLIVLIRPPSLEPSTPDVREPRAWVTLGRVLLLPRPSPRPSPLNGGREGSFSPPLSPTLPPERGEGGLTSARLGSLLLFSCSPGRLCPGPCRSGRPGCGRGRTPV